VTTTEAPPAEPGATPPSRRSYAGAIMVALAAVFVIVAIALTVVGLDARSSASDDNDRAATLTAERQALAKEQHAVDRQREQLRKLANAVSARSSTLNAALNDMVMAQNSFIAVVNRAADLYNGGDHAGAAAAFRSDGAPALAAMVDKNAAVQQAYHAAKAALDRLQAAK
jgi:hypothetical protein